MRARHEPVRPERSRVVESPLVVALLRGPPEELTGLSDVVLNEEVEPFVERETILQVADLLFEGLSV